MTTIALNLRLGGQGGSQFTNYNFTDFVKVGNVSYGLNSSGIHSLDTSDSDNGTDIDAYFSILSINLGVPNQKRIRSGFVNYEGGEIEVTQRFDDRIEHTAEVTPVKPGQGIGKFKGNHAYKGANIQIKVGNVDGDDFSIDQIDIIPFILRLKPSGSRI